MLFPITSAAKCDDYREPTKTFTNRNNKHVRGSLVLIADTQ